MSSRSRTPLHSHSDIPHFASATEEAAFWDAHYLEAYYAGTPDDPTILFDISDFEDVFVEEVFAEEAPDFAYS